MFGGFYTPSQYQYDNWVNIQLTVSKGHFLNLDPGSGQVCLCNQLWMSLLELKRNPERSIPYAIHLLLHVVDQ